ncbi:MAG: tRNA preQ1(34) S-adenosylmethionine ribosyltransferase-isomerase QueA [Candidatus Eremiobacteraeota bacterium]|nr:tRNA preQ1(34) S-adenosylmethionine ribosyltransferase-isomerase QueA [Candidatus Eremiobacteraeota bacterium]NNM93240.1 tRNA preQ1(34) S-adenosylmethionine ribosyltransferase-isomerase QueA [Candidatus Eremiobacteraeota bacterium]
MDVHRDRAAATDERLTAAYDFALPREAIAQQPAAHRDESRLFAISESGEYRHRLFRDLDQALRPDDLLVLNETAVIQARLIGHLAGGGRAEFLLLHPVGSLRYDGAARTWVVLARPGRRLREGSLVSFGDEGEAIVRSTHEDGRREVEFFFRAPFEETIERIGRLPLPPYIHHDDEASQQRYQSIFARVPGSVAAPTASLHFSPELLARLDERGIERCSIVLDIGLGTFRPISTERIDEHEMHEERYEIPASSVAAIEAAKRAGRRVVAVGTTVLRALEGCVLERGALLAGEGATACFIKPGFDFRVVDALITNFHLPRSSLFILVSAFCGRRRMLDAYREAVEREYRFFSFGDAMFLERERR